MSKEISIEAVATKILVIRAKRVMVDRDLANMYGVETKQLVRQVKRNAERFPADFMYQLTREEVVNLRCQNGTSNRGGRRYLPYVFTVKSLSMMTK
jgi:hypothetical protein